MALNFEPLDLSNEVAMHFCEAVNTQASGPQVDRAANDIGAIFETRQLDNGDGSTNFECDLVQTNRVYDSDATDTFGPGFFILEIAVNQVVHVTPVNPMTLEEVTEIVERGFNRGNGGRVRFRSLLQQNIAFNTIVTVEVLEGSLSPPQAAPSSSPSTSPTSVPTDAPSLAPTAGPTHAPSKLPSLSPVTSNPSSSPSGKPSFFPTNMPSLSPSRNPSFSPTKTPTKMPSDQPTSYPSQFPTVAPTHSPSIEEITLQPTAGPSGSPAKTFPQTGQPTVGPSQSPATSPSSQEPSPSGSPTTADPKTGHPTVGPSKRPAESPSQEPSTASQSPTSDPGSPPTRPDPIRDQPAGDDEEDNRLSLILGAIAGGLATILVSLVFIFCVWLPYCGKQKKTASKENENEESNGQQNETTMSSTHLEGAIVSFTDESSSLANTSLGDRTAGRKSTSKKRPTRGFGQSRVSSSSSEDNSLFTSPRNADGSFNDTSASYESSMILPPSFLADFEDEDDFVVPFPDADKSEDSESDDVDPFDGDNPKQGDKHGENSFVKPANKNLAVLEFSDDDTSTIQFVDYSREYESDTDSRPLGKHAEHLNSTHLYDSDSSSANSGNTTSLDGSSIELYQRQNGSDSDGQNESIEEDETSRSASVGISSSNEFSEGSSLYKEDNAHRTAASKISNNELLRSVLEDAQVLAKKKSRSVSISGSSKPSTISAPARLRPTGAPSGPSREEVVNLGVTYLRLPRGSDSSKSVGSPPQPRTFRDFGERAPPVPSRSNASNTMKSDGNSSEKSDVATAGDDPSLPDTPKMQNSSRGNTPKEEATTSAAAGAVMSPAATSGAKPRDTPQSFPSEDSVIFPSDDDDSTPASSPGILGTTRRASGERSRILDNASNSADSDSDGLSNPWLYDNIEQTLGPRSVAADMESLSGKSTGSSAGRSQPSFDSSKSTPVRRSGRKAESPEEQKSELEGATSSVTPRSLENDLKRLQLQLSEALKTNEMDDPEALPKIRTSKTSPNRNPDMENVGKKRQVVVVVPPGKLGVVLANRHDGKGTVVAEVLPSSAMNGVLNPGDKLVAVDGQDVTSNNVSGITSLMASKASTQRKLTIVTSVSTRSNAFLMNESKSSE